MVEIIAENKNIANIPKMISITKEISSTHTERLKSFRHSSSDTENAILSPTLCVQYVV